jgi:uncharacterized protein (PEP-CTERM system associated)
VLLLAPPARAQLLPDTGTTVQVGALHQQLEGLLTPGGGLPNPGWTITPALAAQESWTNQLLEGNGTGTSKSSFISSLLPSVLINGQTLRTNTVVNYAPSLSYYSNGGQTLIAQNLNAASHITVVPERLFLDLNGLAAVQPTYGGYGPAGTSAVSGRSMTQSLSFSAHPYWHQPFGDLATAELGATLSYTAQNGLTANQSNQSSGQPVAAVPGQNAISNQEYFSLTSGPVLGRTSAGLVVSANQQTGTGVLNNAHQDQAVIDLGYALTHSVSVLASAGYDDVHYAGTPPYNYSGAQWSGGVHWIPNPDSSVTASYGSQDGVSSAQLDASYALSARTHVFARYSEGITTGLEQLLNGMNGSTLDAQGNPVASNGSPLQLVNSFYGVQSNLSRTTSASLTVTWLAERDAVSASFSRQQSHQLAAASAASAGNLNTTGWYGTLTWQRSLWPDLNASAFVEWGTSQDTPASTGSSSTTLVFSLNLSYTVSRTVSAYAQYSWTRQTYSGSAAGFPSLPTNLIVIGARKSF